MTSKEIPKEWYIRPPELKDIPEGVFIIQADAAFKRGITGTAVVIKTKNKEYAPYTYARRNRGPIHAELTSIKNGLQRLKKIKRKINLIIVYNDNLYAYYFLNGIWNAEKKYIKKTLKEIRRLVNKMNINIDFIWVKGKYNKRVDRLALKKRKIEEKKKEEQIQKRVMKVEQMIVRSRDIKIYEKKGEYFAISRKNNSRTSYKVSLKPLSCECPWWKNKWGNKPKYIQKARALPCKHMCALAEYLGLNVFDIFKKQINRVD